MGRETPSPKDQGFLNNANRFRVSRDLTPPRQGRVDGHAVNIPQPGVMEVQRRRRSEACAHRRNSAFNAVCIGDGGNVPCRKQKVHELHAAGDSHGGASSREKPRGPSDMMSARTGNRHRWSGRTYRGAREIHGQGTRQTGPVTSGQGALPPAQGEAQRIGPGNCLAKTQGCAKPQGAVYSLTPARCRKVKRSCQSNRSSEVKPR